jgi:thiol-disulfide isomerase/thioredoxin/uncharacterized membrane protein YphA (DoxX/SURF4 family)
MKNLSWPVRILICALFLLSGIAKIYPHIWPFEKQLVDLGIANWCLAPYLARAIIGLELAIGIAILFPYAIKKFIIPITILLLLAFCVHLGIQMYMYGPNNGNCGCFGQLIPMTPLEAFIKNIATIGLLIYLYRKVDEQPENKFKLIYPLVIFLACELFMFAAFPFAPCGKTKKATTVNTPVTNDSLSLAISETSTVDTNSIIGDTSLLNVPATATNIPDSNKLKSATAGKLVQPVSVAKASGTGGNTVKANNASTQVVSAVPAPAKVISKFAAYNNFGGKTIAVDDGKKIICMFAPGCDHCQATAKEICGLRTAGFLEVSIIFMDEEVEKIPEFFKVAGCNFPYQVVDIPTFWTLLGNGTTPGVICLHNGNVTKIWEGIDKNKFESSGLKDAFNVK